jgi:hypothetical protein
MLCMIQRIKDANSDVRQVSILWSSARHHSAIGQNHSISPARLRALNRYYTRQTPTGKRKSRIHKEFRIKSLPRKLKELSNHRPGAESRCVKWVVAGNRAGYRKRWILLIWDLDDKEAREVENRL